MSLAQFFNSVVELTALEKDVNTYYLKTEYNDDGSVKKTSGMLQYVIPEAADGSGIIHHRLNTCATVTGRLSGSNPNLQNLPRDGTSRVKQMFTSRFGEAGRIIEVDYSALEVVMGCVHTGDTKLLGLLQADTDMHVYRLAYATGESYDDVYDKCHNQEHPQHKEYKQLRTDIKPKAFMIQYDATDKGMAFNTGMPLEECRAFIQNERNMFPATFKFRNTVRKEVEERGNEPGHLHREQMDDGTYKIYRRSYWRAPTGMRYSFRQKQQWKDGQQVMDYKNTELANYWCQGEAFFMMAVAFGMIVRHMIQNDWYNGQVCLITNVHDAAYLDAANEEVGREAALAVKHLMETARERILQLWPDYGILSQVPFPAAAEMGSSMYEKKHVE